MTWYIVRTKLGHERRVTTDLHRLGFDAWLPIEVRHHRATRRHLSRTTEHPIMPTVLLSAVPEALHGDLHSVSGFRTIERDRAYTALAVPGKQVAIWKASIAKANAAVERMVEAGRVLPVKQEWQDFRDGLAKFRHEPVDSGDD